MDTYPEQPQPPTHISSKLADLHMSGPFARERGPSGPATADPIFNELPRYTSEPPHVTQVLNHPDRPSAYDHGRSAYPTGRSGTGLFEEDCYLNPHPSQQHFPSQYTMHQPINTVSQTRGASTFWPRLEGWKGIVNSMNHIGQIVMHHITQTNGEEDNMIMSNQPHLCLTREPVVSHQLLLI
jgi:hypothetical protein